MNEMMPFHLSTSEFKVMTVLWDSKEPLTSGEIVEKITTSRGKTFQDRSIYCILNSLLDDGFASHLCLLRFAAGHWPIVLRSYNLQAAGQICRATCGTGWERRKARCVFFSWRFPRGFSTSKPICTAA